MLKSCLIVISSIISSRRASILRSASSNARNLIVVFQAQQRPRLAESQHPVAADTALPIPVAAAAACNSIATRATSPPAARSAPALSLLNCENAVAPSGSFTCLHDGHLCLPAARKAPYNRRDCRLPAGFEARHRRSPSTSTYRPAVPGRTTIGWTTPFTLIVPASPYQCCMLMFSPLELRPTPCHRGGGCPPRRRTLWRVLSRGRQSSGSRRPLGPPHRFSPSGTDKPFGPPFALEAPNFYPRLTRQSSSPGRQESTSSLEPG